MNTTEATTRYQRKTRDELRAMSDGELEEERAALLQSIASVRGQLAAEKMLAECNSRELDHDWVIRAYTSAECMTDTANWISGQLERRKEAAGKVAKSSPPPKQPSEQKKAKAVELAELSLQAATQKRLRVEAEIEMQERAKEEKKVRDAEKLARQRELERIFVDVAKLELDKEVFYTIMNRAKAWQDTLLLAAEAPSAEAV